MRYKPGLVAGGSITHDCGKSRGIGYFLEALILLGLYAKKPLKVGEGVYSEHTRVSEPPWSHEFT